MNDVLSEECFSPEACHRVFATIKMVGDQGMSVNALDPADCLTSGYLTGIGALETVSGGGEEPYVVRACVKELILEGE